MANNGFKIRHAKLKDGDDVLRLMVDLAKFEGYADEFKVTKKDLEERLFKQQAFCVLVAEVEDKITAILVYYYLPFTYDLKPWIYIKELYVDSKHRNQGLGKKLMKVLALEATDKGCSKIRWDVLSSNKAAQSFYQSLGAKHDDDWSLFSLTSNKILELVSV